MELSHEYFMRLAFEEAKKALAKDEVPIGAVIVSEQMVIGRGHNLTQTLCDVTAHAEMQALTAAANHLGAKYLTNCTLYVTIEPCIMCAGALAWGQIGTVVYGAGDSKKGYTRCNSPILHPKTKVITGIMEEECGAIVSHFFLSKRK